MGNGIILFIVLNLNISSDSTQKIGFVCLVDFNQQTPS